MSIILWRWYKCRLVWLRALRIIVYSILFHMNMVWLLVCWLINSITSHLNSQRWLLDGNKNWPEGWIQIDANLLYFLRPKYSSIRMLHVGQNISVWLLALHTFIHKCSSCRCFSNNIQLGNVVWIISDQPVLWPWPAAWCFVSLIETHWMIPPGDKKYLMTNGRMVYNYMVGTYINRQIYVVCRTKNEMDGRRRRTVQMNNSYRQLNVVRIFVCAKKQGPSICEMKKCVTNECRTKMVLQLRNVFRYSDNNYILVNRNSFSSDMISQPQSISKGMWYFVTLLDWFCSTNPDVLECMFFSDFRSSNRVVIIAAFQCWSCQTSEAMPVAWVCSCFSWAAWCWHCSPSASVEHLTSSCHVMKSGKWTVRIAGLLFTRTHQSYFISQCFCVITYKLWRCLPDICAVSSC